ncbi:MAG: baseplate J/gp47 family protein [bacterium]|nr:baseplate J/gp47 family protein [bacterium]
MDLPFFKTTQTPETRKYLFALEISPQTIKSAVWSVINDKTQVLGVGAAVNWDDHNEEDLVTACDQTLTAAASHLDPSGKTIVNEVILGLPADWVEADKIRPAKLSLLKQLAAKLELKPVGFVVTTEAIVKYLHHSENVPPTAILLGFWPQVVDVTLVRMGKIDGTETVKRSSHLADDVVEGLSRFPDVDVLPSRMLLYDSGIDLEEVKQNLLQHHWQAPQEKLPFLHFPKVEVLPSDYSVRAIALAGGTEVAQAIGMISAPEPTLPVEEEASSDLGFVADADIRTMTPQELETPQISETAEPEREAKPPLAKPKLTLKLPRIPWPQFKTPHPKFSLAALIAVAIVLLTLGGAAYWYIPKADVVIYVQPKNFEAKFDLVADTGLETMSQQDKAIPAKSLTVEVTASKSAPATGSLLVGDKATGSVTIQNNLDSSRQLAAGTVLTSPSGLKFVLDEAVTVASASGDVFNPSPGKATAKVTAANIGSDSNLSAGTVFRVGSLAVTQVAAKNETALSGGSSRQAKAIAKEDISSLRSALTGDLKEQARQKLTEQIADDQMLIAESITVETVSEDFNHKLGEEADEVTLDLTVKAVGIVVAKADLQILIDAQIKPQVPQGYGSVSQLNQSFKVTDSDENKITFTVEVTAQLLPQIDQNEVLGNIRGKSFDRARQYLESLPSVSTIDILVAPRPVSYLRALPRVAKNITLSVRPAQ